MNGTRTTKTTKRLTLTRETLRTLTTDELRLVNGGRNLNCTQTSGKSPDSC